MSPLEALKKDMENAKELGHFDRMDNLRVYQWMINSVNGRIEYEKSQTKFNRLTPDELRVALRFINIDVSKDMLREVLKLAELIEFSKKDLTLKDIVDFKLKNK